MKKYRVTKEHPFLKEGLELYANNLIPDKLTTDSIRPVLTQMTESEANNHPTWFEEIESRWKPYVSEWVWVLRGLTIHRYSWIGDGQDLDNYNDGTVFRTVCGKRTKRDNQPTT